MILENKGVQLGSFFVPPFHMHQGELVGINFHNGPYSIEPMQTFLSMVLDNNSQEINTWVNFEEATVIRHGRWWQLARPKRVRGLLSAQTDRALSELRGFGAVYLSADKKINHCDLFELKLLSLWFAFEKQVPIVFNLAGLSPMGVERCLKFVKSRVETGSAALLLDHWEDSAAFCDQYYTVQSDHPQHFRFQPAPFELKIAD